MHIYAIYPLNAFTVTPKLMFHMNSYTHPPFFKFYISITNCLIHLPSVLETLFIFQRSDPLTKIVYLLRKCFSYYKTIFPILIFIRVIDERINCDNVLNEDM